MRSLESRLRLKWRMIELQHPESPEGYVYDVEGFVEKVQQYCDFLTSKVVAKVTNNQGAECYVIAMDAGMYLDDREWLEVIYANPEDGLSPHDWYSGYWLPNGIRLNS